MRNGGEKMRFLDEAVFIEQSGGMSCINAGARAEISKVLDFNVSMRRRNP